MPCLIAIPSRSKFCTMYSWYLRARLPVPINVGRQPKALECPRGDHREHSLLECQWARVSFSKESPPIFSFFPFTVSLLSSTFSFMLFLSPLLPPIFFRLFFGFDSLTFFVKHVKVKFSVQNGSLQAIVQSSTFGVTGTIFWCWRDPSSNFTGTCPTNPALGLPLQWIVTMILTHSLKAMLVTHIPSYRNGKGL